MFFERKFKSIKNLFEAPLAGGTLSKDSGIKSIDFDNNQDNLTHSYPAIIFQIDIALQSDEYIFIVGWSSKPEVNLQISEMSISTLRWVRRADVATHLKSSPDKKYGFIILINKIIQYDQVKLILSATGATEAVGYVRLTPVSSLDLKINAIRHRVLKHKPFAYCINSKEFSSYVGAISHANGFCNTAKGFLEVAVATEGKNSHAVVVGWLAKSDATQVWLEDDRGNIFSIDNAFRLDRQDVRTAIAGQVSYSVANAGFACYLFDMKPSKLIKLKALNEQGIYTLGEVACESLTSTPIEAAKWLAKVEMPLSSLHSRIPKVDKPLIDALLSQVQAQWKEFPTQVHGVGQAVVNPLVSVIIPLYGRIDFVEHQLMEFSEDKWFQQNAELIFVLDDPNIIENFTTQAESLFRIYKIPFKWVWGGVNRGFSGANNLGASLSSGKNLIFLNSDAFPKTKDWAKKLIDVLNQHPNIGAVGPRLLFADGSIQHAGMTFLRREELGIWINHHPRMGLDPTLDLYSELEIVPAITGACLAINRDTFDKINGWDTGYLIGDFEDSDLCLKLRQYGLDVAYEPSVELTHLERQSFKLLGENEFRTKVVILNAVRHQDRWGKFLEQNKLIYDFENQLLSEVY